MLLAEDAGHFSMVRYVFDVFSFRIGAVCVSADGRVGGVEDMEWKWKQNGYRETYTVFWKAKKEKGGRYQDVEGFDQNEESAVRCSILANIYPIELSTSQTSSRR